MVNNLNPRWFQVGLTGDSTSFKWFVEAPNVHLTPQPYVYIQCLRGTGFDDLGIVYGIQMYSRCFGDNGDIVSLTQSHKVELVTYNETLNGHFFWIARVSDADGNANDVARIFVDIFPVKDVQVSAEEGYNGTTDPHATMGLVQKDPKYNLYSGDQLWPWTTFPTSATNKSSIIASSDFCPSFYSATPNSGGSEWAWYAGSGAVGVCSWTLYPPLGSGTVDDATTTYIDYEPVADWSHLQNSDTANAILGTLSVSSNNDNAAFSFHGNSISYFYSMGPNRGTQTIKIDGVNLDTLNSNAAQYRRQIGKTWSISPVGDHTIQVFGGGTVDVDAFSVNIATYGPGTYDDPNAAIRYFGTWGHYTGQTGAYNSTLSWTNQWQSGARLTFSGSSVIYCYSKAYNRGIAAITIDGVFQGYIDLYSPSVLRQQCTPYNLSSGTHILNITNTGTHNNSSSDYFVDIDDIVVQ